MYISAQVIWNHDYTMYGIELEVSNIPHNVNEGEKLTDIIWKYSHILDDTVIMHFHI